MASQSQDPDTASATISKTFETLTSGFGVNLESLMKANAQASQVWMENCSKISRELMDFMNIRWTKDLEAAQKLGECRDPFQAFQIQADTVQTAMKQYIDEAAKLTDMTTDASVSCFKSIDKGVREAAASSDDGRKAA